MIIREFIKLTDIEDQDQVILPVDNIGCVFMYDHEKHGKVVCVALRNPIHTLGRTDFLVDEDIDYIFSLLDAGLSDHTQSN